jgi:hypothetical protein
VRGGICATLTARRTSWSLRTLQEQTIMDGNGSLDGSGMEILKTATGCKTKKRLFKRFQTACRGGGAELKSRQGLQ